MAGFGDKKWFFLGTAAGFVAMSGAQAADLPVKGKPVQYVKICSLYGAGFYYIPGSDTCLKIGGYLRQELMKGPQLNGSSGVFNGQLHQRQEHDFLMRTRAYATFDARSQTEFGTARGYLAVGVFYDSPNATTFNSNRGFVQVAGFTFGTAQSFFDFYSVAAAQFWGNHPFSDTDVGGWKVTGYTAQFGNGFSATIAAEEPRRTNVLNASFATASAFGSVAADDKIGIRWPDIVGNLRVDQAWGSAQIMGSVHDASAANYDNNPGTAQNMDNGHPSNATGWVVGGGLKLNASMIAPGDWFQVQVNYTQGALGYLFNQMKASTGSATGFSMMKGSTVGFGMLTDGVFSGTGVAATQTSIDLTTAWGVNASYEHFWSPKWQTSVYGYYYEVSYNATANAALCTLETAAYVTNTNGTACDNNWQTWGIGSRTQYNIDAWTYLGVDVMYNKLQTAMSGLVGVTKAANGALPVGQVVTVGDMDAWQFRFRIHRDFGY